jgi:hypothetical protein
MPQRLHVLFAGGAFFTARDDYGSVVPSHTCTFSICAGSDDGSGASPPSLPTRRPD